MNDGWLESVKAGDVALLSGGSWGVVLELVRVERLTATQVVLANGERFRRSDGRAVRRSGFSTRRMIEPTPERIAQAQEEQRRNRALAKIRGVVWKDLGTDTLTAIASLLEENR